MSAAENMTSVEAVKLPYRFAREFGLALSQTDKGVTLHIGDAANRNMIVEVARNYDIALIEEVSQEQFDDLLSELYARRSFEEDSEQADADRIEDDFDAVVQGVEHAADLLAGDDDAPVIRLLNSLLSEAVRSGASDVHLEPFENNVLVRLRIDGMLQEIASLSPKLAPYLVSRIKVMSRLDIAEKRLPQDGRLSLTLGGKVFDVRVSTLPIRYGERVVMRLLDKDNAFFGLGDLGMAADMRAQFEGALREPNGIILVTGPTGSGKTTTLYSALSLMNDTSRNIMTVEDPVEYALHGISQTQVNPKIGMTFADGLRSILRQDPDTVMVGEIRDKETAEIAVQASLTGHVVLSTVHTNSAAAAVTRLMDMGIEPLLLSSSLRLVLAQRLVRRLCPDCKVPDENDDIASHKPVGCPSCQNIGYRGRIGIFELLSVDDTVRQMIADGATEQQIEAYAFANGGLLAASGHALVAAGETSMAEVFRVARVSA
ncbi:MAG: Type II secretion system protein E [Alphaproteobacteria bacterium]|nr:MAG: Type II secretion system protein E [Alphaproteobacteria bacterium]